MEVSGVLCRSVLDLYRGVQRANRYADCGAGVHAGLAEGLAEQLRDAVGDLGLAGEVGGGGDESDHLDHALDLVEVTDQRLHRSDGVEATLLGAGDGLLLGDLTADLAGGDELAGLPRQLAREIGRASCRERVCQYVSISVGAGSLKKKKEET